VKFVTKVKSAKPMLDIVIVGAGFAGLHMLHAAREAGLQAHIVETASDVGGTWYWNRYPGARCDVESLVYAYSFSPLIDAEWRWTERYATQPEIQRYLSFVAARLDLRRDISFNTMVNSARFDDPSHSWAIETDAGEVIQARFCIMATGPLSTARIPEMEGLADYRGELYHTGAWPKSPVSFHGKRVGIIGTGSSGTQLIPVAAQDAGHLFVFMRTPNYSVPARNAPLDAATYARWEADRDDIRDRLRHGDLTGSGDCFIPEDLRATRKQKADAFSDQEQQDIFQRRWDAGGALLPGSFADLMLDEKVNERAASFVAGKIAALVENPETAARLTPRTYPFAAKRLCVDTDFYATFNRENVTLVDVRANPIERLTQTGIVTQDGEYPLDMLIFATGFDAMTGTLAKIDISGRDGRSLRKEWEHGPRTYLGLMVEGFPNLFLIGAPGSPSVMSNVVASNELQVDFISAMLRRMTCQDETLVEADAQAQVDWVDHVNAVAAPTLFMKADSWYLGANIPGKPRVFLPYAGGLGRYRQKCEAVAQAGFEGFRFTSAADTERESGARLSG
jgi:cation diffusion facilitator CzcD-associated flavoprotein CzcO